MPLYRNGLPQLSGDIFLTDAGVETVPMTEGNAD
jgi:hypothetical protein